MQYLFSLSFILDSFCFCLHGHLSFLSAMSNYLLISSSIFLSLDIIQHIFICINSIWAFAYFSISLIMVIFSFMSLRLLIIFTLGLLTFCLLFSLPFLDLFLLIHIFFPANELYFLLVWMLGNFWLDTRHQEFYIVDCWMLYSFSKRWSFCSGLELSNWQISLIFGGCS